MKREFSTRARPARQAGASAASFGITHDLAALPHPDDCRAPDASDDLHTVTAASQDLTALPHPHNLPRITGASDDLAALPHPDDLPHP